LKQLRPSYRPLNSDDLREFPNFHENATLVRRRRMLGGLGEPEASTPAADGAFHWQSVSNFAADLCEFRVKPSGVA
jgi:hypothetical protein